MKKIYMFGLIGICATAMAQAPKVKSTLTDVAVPATKITDRVSPSPVRVNPDNRVLPSQLFTKSARFLKIGTTQNDQQTNASIYRHIHAFADGKLSATWTTSTDQSPYMQRGSGYNHFDGTGWGPISGLRIDPERSGFPNYVYNPTTNEEIIMSHIVKAQGTPNAGAAGGLLMNRKTGLGAGTWNTTTVLDTTITIPGVLWNRNAISGDYMHVIASYTDSSQQQPSRVYINGIRTPQVYSRYKFSNSTWEVKNVLLPEYDSTRYWSGGGDNYSIDAQGSNVAILIGGLTDDVALWKSTDNGSNWTKTIIDSFPVPAYNYKTVFDTALSNDGGMHVMLDNNGKAHCFWGLARVLDVDSTDNSVSYFPGQLQIRYWQEGWHVDSTRTIAGANDENNDGTFTTGSSWNATGARYGNHSIVTMPYAGITASGDMYMIYSSLTENDEATDGKNYRDIYAIRSTDGGNTWSDAVNLTSWLGLNVEQIFGSMAKNIAGTLHITFMQKTSIGRFDATDNPGAVGPYDICHIAVDTSIFTEPLVGLKKINNELFTIEQNFPNPFENITNITVNFKQSTDATVTVKDLMGREIYLNTFRNVPTGKSNLELNMGSIPAGVYIYTIEANGISSTGRMISK